MSFHAMKWAAEQKLPAMQKIVLLMLANRMNKDSGLCCPSHDMLAIDCGMTKRSVIQQIEKLEQSKFLTVVRETKGNVKQVNKYRLTISSESDSLGVVNDVHYPSESDSLGVVNDVHINQETITSNITTTTEKKLSEKNCGGGDFSGSKKTVLSSLIFPKNLTQKEQLYAEKLLSNCDGHAQEILDALDAAIQAGQIKKSPLAFLGGLIRRQEIGTFDPTPGMHIATARAKQKRTQESINASIKKHHAETSVKSKAERIKPNEQINAMKQALKKSH